MVSRGISTPDIIKGIHLSVANRIVKLLSSLKAEGPVMLTGGLALNEGMVGAMKELMAKSRETNLEVLTHPDAIYAGAIGAALWGGYRYLKLKEKTSSGARSCWCFRLKKRIFHSVQAWKSTQRNTRPECWRNFMP
jgi:hypothetical protein